MHRGGRGDARASCASPLGTPLPIGDGWEEVLVRNVSHYVPVLLLGTRYRPAFSSCDGGSPSLNILYLPGLEHAAHLIES